MKIILEGTPVSTNSLYRRHGYIMYMSKEGKDLKESYQWQAKSQWKQDPTDKPVEVFIKLYFKDKRLHDIDNYNKILFDSLTGIVWLDDNQITKMTVEKFINKERPSIEIEIL